MPMTDDQIEESRFIPQRFEQIFDLITFRPIG